MSFVPTHRSHHPTHERRPDTPGHTRTRDTETGAGILPAPRAGYLRQDEGGALAVGIAGWDHAALWHARARDQRAHPSGESPVFPALRALRRRWLRRSIRRWRLGNRRYRAGDLLGDS